MLQAQACRTSRASLTQIYNYSATAMPAPRRHLVANRQGSTGLSAKSQNPSIDRETKKNQNQANQAEQAKTTQPNPTYVNKTYQRQKKTPNLYHTIPRQTEPGKKTRSHTSNQTGPDNTTPKTHQKRRRRGHAGDLACFGMGERSGGGEGGRSLSHYTSDQRHRHNTNQIKRDRINQQKIRKLLFVSYQKHAKLTGKTSGTLYSCPRSAHLSTNLLSKTYRGSSSFDSSAYTR